MKTTYCYCAECHEIFAPHWEEVSKEGATVETQTTEDMLFCDHPAFECDNPADLIVTVTTKPKFPVAPINLPIRWC